MPMLGTQCVWEFPAATISQNGNSGQVDVTDWSNFILMVAIGGTPSGSVPTLAIHIDGYDAYGNAYPDIASPEPVLQFAAAANAVQEASMGLNAQFVAATAPGTPGNFNLLFCAPQHIGIRWVLGGTNPSYPGVVMSLFAR